MTNYLITLEIAREDMNFWRERYSNYRKELGKTNREIAAARRLDLPLTEFGWRNLRRDVMRAMNFARSKLKTSIHEVEIALGRA